MRLPTLRTDEEATAPVISVILMVGITVVLAAVLGFYVFDIGREIQDSAPQAGIDFETDSVPIDDGSGSDGQKTVTAVDISHDGGKNIDASNLRVVVDGTTAYGVTDGGDTDGVNTVAQVSDAGTFSASTTITVVAASDATLDFATNTPEYDVDGSGNLDLLATEDGSSVDSTVSLSSGQTVRVIYDSPDSDMAVVLADYEIP